MFLGPCDVGTLLARGRMIIRTIALIEQIVSSALLGQGKQMMECGILNRSHLWEVLRHVTTGLLGCFAFRRRRCCCLIFVRRPQPHIHQPSSP